MSRPLPEIFIERNDSDMPRSLQPDREFWRYLFAGMAMQGMLANQGDTEARAGCAKVCCDCADALLSELEEGKEAGDG